MRRWVLSTDKHGRIDALGPEIAPVSAVLLIALNALIDRRNEGASTESVPLSHIPGNLHVSLVSQEPEEAYSTLTNRPSVGWNQWVLDLRLVLIPPNPPAEAKP